MLRITSRGMLAQGGLRFVEKLCHGCNTGLRNGSRGIC